MSTQSESGRVDYDKSNLAPKGTQVAEFDPVRHMEAVTTAVARMNKIDADRKATKGIQKIKDQLGVK